MSNSIISIYNEYIQNKRNSIYYYGDKFNSNEFDALNVDDLGFYFSSGDKCFINSEISDYLKGQPWEKFRVKHVFSVYLLGIYCYDNIETIRCSLNSFIKNEIWKDPNTSPSEEEKVLLRKSFLYLWYLTALYHDMGYYFEKKDDENNIISDMVVNQTMFKKENLGNQTSISGIPKALVNSSSLYFFLRKTNTNFHNHLCVDHGFAGGIRLFKDLKHFHCETSSDEQENDSIDKQKVKTIKSPIIFYHYNIPAAWAIICHNIWTAIDYSLDEYKDRMNIYPEVMKFFDKIQKYMAVGLNELIVAYGKPLINYIDHPLLFLLDFIDTIEPLKTLCSDENKEEYDITLLNYIVLSYSENRLSFHADTKRLGKGFLMLINKKWSRLSSNLDYLKSSRFKTRVNENSISFQIGA